MSRRSALRCVTVTNAYIVVYQIRASSVCIMFARCVCSVCLHRQHFSVLYCVYTVLQVRHFVSRVAFGDHRAHDNVRVTLFSPFVAFDTALFTLDIFLLNKKNNPGGELPLLLEKGFMVRTFLVS